MEGLAKIEINDWGKLRDLYRKEWPKYLTSYMLIDTVLRWEKSNKTLDFVELYSLDNSWPTHGTYFLSVSSRL